MPLSYTTEELLNEVRARSVTNDTDAPGWLDSDLLLYLNGEMLNEIIPHVAKLQEEFMVVTEIISIPVGTQTVQVPDRAVATR